MKTMTLKDYLAALKAQGAKSTVDACFVCPMCGTVHSGNDLIAAGAGESFEDIEGFLGFSCVGRWTHNRPPPGKDKKGTQDGCNWTLGGLFSFHELEVETEDGKKHPRFEPATPEQAHMHNESKQYATTD